MYNNEEAMNKSYSDRNYADNMTTANGAAREGSIPRSYSELATGLAVLDERITELERLLGPVLRNEPPQQTSAPEVREAPSCAMSEAISRDANFLRTSNTRLDNIIRRIEV